MSSTQAPTGVVPKAPQALCHKCPFINRPVALSTGPKDAKIAVVSRSPGQHEAMAGKSFSGPSGKVLDHLLSLQGASRESVLATNSILCQSDGTENGFGMALECCRPRLEHEIANADTIIAAGREASYVVTGRTSIAASRGYVHWIESPVSKKKQRAIITNNPAVILRDDGNFPELVRDFRLAINPLPQPKLPSVKWIEDLNEAKTAVVEMLRQISPETLLASDIETRGVDGGTGLDHNAQIVCAGFSIRTERAVVFGEAPCTSEDFLYNFLPRLYTIPNVRYLWHNGKYDIKVLRTKGINARVDEDTMLLSYALDERPGDPTSGAGGHALEWLLKDELGWPNYEPESVRHFKRTGQFLEDGDGSTKRSRIDLYQYNGCDTAGALALFELLRQAAKNDNVWDRPYRKTLVRLSEALTKVELQGNIFDADTACDILEGQVWPKLGEHKRKLRRLSGKTELNPASPQQLSSLIYDDWGVTHQLFRGKVEGQGKKSTDQWVRETILHGKYACDTTAVNPTTVETFVQELDDFKTLFKWKGTTEGYVLRRSSNGRLYTVFNIHGTESGRLSSANPNLQNVTRPKEGLPNIRRAIVPDAGCQFISGDLNQAELRTIAVLSGDKALQAIYLETGRSLHKEVAAEFYGKDYTYEQYVRAKNINFGVAYWQSAYAFAQMYHMDQSEAQKYIDFWWERFPDVYKWTKAMEQKVLTEGEIQSPFGHKRRFYVIPNDLSARIHIVKQGINFLPQNIAANITLSAMCELTEKLDPEIAQVRLTVHDNITVNCRTSHVKEVAPVVKLAMERAVKEDIGWEFPFTAELSTGYNYGDLEELKL